MATVDDFIGDLGEPERAALQRIRDIVAELAPEAEQGTSYGLPAFIYRRKPLLGLRVAANHLSLFPFSSEVVEAVSPRLQGFQTSKGTVRFTAEDPVPDDVLREIVSLRMGEITGHGAR